MINCKFTAHIPHPTLKCVRGVFECNIDVAPPDWVSQLKRQFEDEFNPALYKTVYVPEPLQLDFYYVD